MFQRKMKKLTASLLLFFMVFSIMPVQVWAEESTTGSAIEWVPNEDECTDPSHNHGTEGDNNSGNAEGTEETDEEKAAREEAERLAAEQAAQVALLADYTAEADELLAGYQAAIDDMTLADVEAALAAIDALDADAKGEMNADTYAAFTAHALFAFDADLLDKQAELEQATKDKAEQEAKEKEEAEKAEQEQKEAEEARQALLNEYNTAADELLAQYPENVDDMTQEDITAALAAIADFDAEAQAALGEDYAAFAAAHALYAYAAELEAAVEEEEEDSEYSEAYREIQTLIDDMLNWYLNGNLDATEEEIEAIIAEMDSTTA